jgi:hypothetical protein
VKERVLIDINTSERPIKTKKAIFDKKRTDRMK